MTKLGAALTWLALIPLRGLEALVARLDDWFVERNRRALEDELRRRGRLALPDRWRKMPDGTTRRMRRCGTSNVRLAQLLEARNPGWKIGIHSGPPTFLTLDEGE